MGRFDSSHLMTNACHCERSEAIPKYNENRDYFVVKDPLLVMTTTLLSRDKSLSLRTK